VASCPGSVKPPEPCGRSLIVGDRTTAAATMVGALDKGVGVGFDPPGAAEGPHGGKSWGNLALPLEWTSPPSQQTAASHVHRNMECRKPPLRICSEKGVGDVSASKGAPYRNQYGAGNAATSRSRSSHCNIAPCILRPSTSTANAERNGRLENNQHRRWQDRGVHG
jgi:hypothetical protein